MVEGGGLGVFRPEEIGPSEVQSRSGVIDVLVARRGRRRSRVARRYLAVLPGAHRAAAGARRPGGAARRCCRPTGCASTTSARSSTALVDPGSTLELRAGFGAGIVTALARIDGRPVGLLASNPAHLGGAIDADAADKAARFMQLCDAHGAAAGLAHRHARLHGRPGDRDAAARCATSAGCSSSPRNCACRSSAIVLRKAYGLGRDGDGRRAACTRRWRRSPGRAASSARWAWKARSSSAIARSSAAAPEGAEREALRERLVAAQYEKGKAIHMAATLEIDAVIDPADSRRWLAATLESARLPEPGGRFIDPW